MCVKFKWREMKLHSMCGSQSKLQLKLIQTNYVALHRSSEERGLQILLLNQEKVWTEGTITVIKPCFRNRCTWSLSVTGRIVNLSFKLTTKGSCKPLAWPEQNVFFMLSTGKKNTPAMELFFGSYKMSSKFSYHLMLASDRRFIYALWQCGKMWHRRWSNDGVSGGGAKSSTEASGHGQFAVKAVVEWKRGIEVTSKRTLCNKYSQTVQKLDVTQLIYWVFK